MGKSSPKGFDPSMIDTCIDDIKALSGPAQKAFVDFVQLLAGKAKMQAARPLKCGPGGCADCCECLDFAVQAQLSALAATIQAQQCLDQPAPAPTPTPTPAS